MTGEEEQFPADAPIAHFESPTSLRVKSLTVEKPAQSPTVPAEPQTETKTDLPPKHSTEPPTVLSSNPPTESLSNRSMEPPTDPRTAEESQDMIRDLDDESKASEVKEHDEKGTDSSKTLQEKLDGRLENLEPTEVIHSPSAATAVLAQHFNFDGSEGPSATTTTTTTGVLSPVHGSNGLPPPTQVNEPQPHPSYGIEITRFAPNVLDQPRTQESRRASSNLFQEASPPASVEDVVADNETATHGQRPSTQTRELGPGTL
jgi:hypothetical protein